ncbi:hypothetical protein HNV12_12255 [Methanococcoides sp. SA1]|nr:hypothetical protein [Methanococcoides sp. SA1]
MVRTLFHDKQAITAVVSVLLILVVLTTFVTAIRAYYIPDLATDHEIRHMQEVHDSFSEFSAKACSDTSNGFVHISLGDGGLPFFSSISSSGIISLDPNGSDINITMENISEIKRDVTGLTTTNDITNISSLRMWTNDLKEGKYSISINNSSENKTFITIRPSGALLTETFENNISYGKIIVRTGGAGDSLILGNSFGMDLLNPGQSEFGILLNNTSNNQSEKVPFSLTFNGSFQLTCSQKNETLNISTGYFKFRASNNYWIDQEFIFENGAVILKQGRNAQVRSGPFMSLENNGSLLHICTFNVTGKESSLSGNGNAIVTIQTIGKEEYLYTNVSNTRIAIRSEQNDAWNEFLMTIANETSCEEGIMHASFYNKTVKITNKQINVKIP